MQRYRIGLLTAIVGLALALCGGALLAQDTDGDGVSDAIEGRLATDPNVADELVAIAEDPTGEGAEREQYARGYDLTGVLFGNVGQDRYVWCLEFVDDFLADNAIVILYVDADNDPSTGRKQGAEGTDYQLHFSLGGGSCTQYAPDGQTGAGPLPRFAVDGKRLYCTFDVKLKQDAGQSVYRLSVLSEKREPHVGVDSVGWLEVKGPGESEREKIMTDDDLTENLNMTMTRGEDLIERLRADAENVHVPVSECELDGFTMSDDEYREWSARRTGAPAAIRVKAPKGTYRPGIFVRDEGGPEKYALYLAGERKGLGIADDDDNRSKLLFMDEPVTFAGDETLEFRAGQAAGGYRVESVIFLAEKPEVSPRKFEITYLEATQLHAPLFRDPTQVRLTWVTTWPVACKIEFGEGDQRNQTLAEASPLANHRVLLRDLKPGQRYSARVVATTPAGQEVATKPVTFVAGERPKRPGRMADLVRVPLSVLNASGVALTDWPVETGVALPLGLLMPSEQVRVVDGAGKWLIVQTEPRALWPDGSVKWLGLTFLASIGPEERTPLWLELGAQVQVPDRPAASMARLEGERITVRTGAATFELPGKEAHQLLGGLTATGAPGPVCRELTGALQDAELVGYRLAVDPARTKLEANGTVRCVVRLGGTFVSEADPTRRLFDWEARVTAYRGQPFVRVLFTVGNDCSDQDFTEIRSVSLTGALGGTATGAQIGGDAGSAPLNVAVGDTLYQHHDDGWTLSSGATGTHAAGWASATGGGAPLTVAVRDFWQQYPKSLGLRTEGIDIGLLPPLTADQYAEESKDPVELVKLYYYLQNGVYKLRQGVTKTHELYLIAGKPEDVPMQALQNPLAACADPEWTRSTGAWGNMPIGDDFWATIYDETMDRGFAAYLKDREDTQAYGALNFGDWWGERKYNWGNIEYDTQHAFFQQFVRTGDLRYYYAAEQAARHNGDVDTVHFHSDPNRVGGVYTHSLGHTGSYFPAGVVDGGSPTAGFSDSHTWTEGHLEAFMLTGDRRHLDNALLITDFYSGSRLNNYDYYNAREPGWHLILTLATWHATGDPYYLNAAHIITERVLERERPGGGWRRHMVPGHCYDEPRHHGEAGFMVGVLMRGLKDMHLATGDERLPPVIIRAAKNMVAEMYGPEEEGFCYTSCPNMKPSPGMNLTSAEGFGYAVTRSADPELARIFERGMVIALRSMGGMGKSISHATRGTPHALRDLESLAGTGYRVGPSGEYTFLLSQEKPEAFEVQVRRLSGEGSATAELSNGDGTWTQTAEVTAAQTSAWVDVPATAVPGTVQLVLKTTGNAAWTVMSTCLRDVAKVGEAFTVAAGKTQLHLASPAAGKAAVRVRSTGKGTATASAPGSVPVTEEIGAAWTSLSLRAGAPFCVLRIDCEAPVEMAIEGAPPYVSADRWHLFAVP
jgi:hypothetical protein